MIRHSVLIAFRNLIRNKIFTVINISGFSVGLCSFILLFLFIRHEMSYDHFHQNYQNIYQVTDSVEGNAQMDLRLKQYLVDNFPEVENACLVSQGSFNLQLSNKKGNVIETQHLLYADSSFFQMFSFELLEGDPEHVFDQPYSIVLTEQTAKELFQDEDPMGQVVNVHRFMDFTVTGIVADPPANSSMQFDYITGAHKGNHPAMRCESCNPSDPEDPGIVYLYAIFLKLQDNADIASLVSKIENPVIFNEHFPHYLSFQHLGDLHLYSDFVGFSFKHGNPKLLQILGAIAVIILILAVVNYVNLTISRSSLRIREIGIKKTFGATRNKILFQLLVESGLVCVGSFLLGLALTAMVFPYFNSITGFGIVPPKIDTGLLFLLIVFPLVLGAFTGLLPGYILSKFKPVSTASGKLIKLGKYKVLKTGFNIFQFAIATCLLICLMVINKQLQYVKSKDLGFNEEQLLQLNIGRIAPEKIQSFRARLMQHPNVSHTSLTGSVPGNIQNRRGFGEDLKVKGSAAIINIDSSFFETFGMNLLSGRKALPGDRGKVCYINQTAQKKLELESYEGRKFHDRYEIIGVVEDFHFSSMHQPIAPLCLLFESEGNDYLSLRIDGRVHDTMSYLKKEWKTFFPDYLLQYEFYDDWFDAMYRAEEKLSSIISFFTLLALIISSLGIFGLAEFVSKQRTKEIGIRKVIGATVQNIVFLLSGDFTKWVLLSFLLAIPISFYTMTAWLEGFSYRTDLDWWVFALAGTITMLIALTTISFQTVRAALANPVEALRCE